MVISLPITLFVTSNLGFSLLLLRYLSYVYMKMSARCTKDGPIKRTETYFQNCSFIRSLPKWIDEPLALVSVHDGLERGKKWRWKISFGSLLSIGITDQKTEHRNQIVSYAAGKSRCLICSSWNREKQVRLQPSSEERSELEHFLRDKVTA